MNILAKRTYTQLYKLNSALLVACYRSGNGKEWKILLYQRPTITDITRMSHRQGDKRQK